MWETSFWPNFFSVALTEEFQGLSKHPTARDFSLGASILNCLQYTKTRESYETEFSIHLNFDFTARIHSICPQHIRCKRFSTRHALIFYIYYAVYRCQLKLFNDRWTVMTSSCGSERERERPMRIRISLCHWNQNAVWAGTKGYRNPGKAGSNAQDANCDILAEPALSVVSILISSSGEC